MEKQTLDSDNSYTIPDNDDIYFIRVLLGYAKNIEIDKFIDGLIITRNEEIKDIPLN
jgi:hypothetical protein